VLFRSEAELRAHLTELDQMAQGTIKPSDIRREKELLDDLMEAADVDGDGYVDTWELIAHSLGRRKTPVELLLYDISKGGAKRLGGVLLGREVEANHSAVLAFGKEWWYGGKIFQNDPPCKAFGQPKESTVAGKMHPSAYQPELQSLHLGFTFATKDEFFTFLQGIAPNWTGLHQYDLLTHSCNHFSSQCISFLTGGDVPERVLELQNIALTPTVKMVRPYLNKWLGGFGEARKNCPEDAMFHYEPGSQAQTNVVKDMLGDCEIVQVKGVEGHGEDLILASVLAETSDHVKIKFFDACRGATVTESINVSQIVRRKVIETGIAP